MGLMRDAGYPEPEIEDTPPAPASAEPEAAPADAADVATKSYVDAATANVAGEGHTHAAADLASGTLDPARLPVATQSAAGAMPAALFSRVSGATSAATASTLAMRDAAGRVQVAEPIF